MRKILKREKRELASLYKLGASIEELQYLIRQKFGLKVAPAGIISLLFPLI